MSNTDQFDPFKGDSGLKDDFDGVIIEGWFGMDPNNSDNKSLMAYLKVNADDGEQVEPRYSTGTGWSSFDGGITAEHEKDNERRRGFNNRCAYFELTASAMAVGAEGEMRRRSQQELNNNGPRDMRLWKGLKFHWEIKTETFKLNEGQPNEREVTSNRLLPTAFLGVVGDATSTPGSVQGNSVASFAAPQPTVAPATAPSQPPPSPGAPTSAGTLIAQPGPIQQPGAVSGPPQQPPAQPTEPQPAQQVAAPPADVAPTVAAPADQGQQPAQQAVQQATAQATQQASAPAAGTPDWSFWTQLSPELQTGIASASKQLPYPSFVDAVLALPGAVESGMLVQALGDENLYNALRNQ